MIQLITMLLLIYIATMGTLYSCIDLLKKKKPKGVAMMPPIVLNYENDIKFLDQLILRKIDLLHRYVLIPKKYTDTSIPKEEEIDNYKLKLTFEVFEGLSVQYKNQLYKYFSEDELKVYISETIMDSLNSIILKGVIKK